MDVDGELLEVEGWIIREFSISCEVRCKKDGFKCRITTVYGTVYEDKRQCFIDELFKIVLDGNKPSIIGGGGFNLVRSQKDKSNGRVDLKWCDSFINWIDKSSLVEIKLMGRNFTWTNIQENALMSSIDRIFCSTDFEVHIP
jgi:hypothetical protein